MAKWDRVIIVGSAIIAVFSAGVGIGHLLEKRKVDNLKEQVSSLQECNKRLLAMLENHEQIIEQLVIKNKIASIENIVNCKDDERLSIVFEYALKEYASIYIASCKGEDVTKVDREFFNSMDDLIEGREVKDDIIKQIIDRVLSKHGYKIRTNIKPYYGFLVNEIDDMQNE